tara:strand:+ start:1662 stop:2114 length:453 start_codon:yes stop_codon:yes gene_type:complete
MCSSFEALTVDIGILPVRFSPSVVMAAMHPILSALRTAPVRACLSTSFVPRARMLSSSIPAQDIYANLPQTKAEIAKLGKEDFKAMTDKEVLSLVRNSLIPSYKLEAVLGDLHRAVVIRRSLVQEVGQPAPSYCICQLSLPSLSHVGCFV